MAESREATKAPATPNNVGSTQKDDRLNGNVGKPSEAPPKSQSVAIPWVYDLILWFFYVLFSIFFRQILPRGAWKIPKKGPVIIVAAPHANQFVDPMLVMQQARYLAGRRVSFLIAEKSLTRPFIGLMARQTGAIGVVRIQDNLTPGSGTIYCNENDRLRIFGNGTKFKKECMVGGHISLSKGGGMTEIREIVSDTELVIKREFKSKGYEQLLSGKAPYKVADHVDQSQMFHRVFQHLRSGNCVGIYPEGGSHDRPDLLPLKAGVAMMALGALAEDRNCNVQIVPCGMNYFHPHKFRSRAVIEFGDPLSVPDELIDDYIAGGDKKRDAVKTLLDTITVALKSVTVTCEDYDTLMAVQAARRLYHPQGKKIPLPVVVEMTRKFVEGYNTYKDVPRVKHLREMVMQYNKDLQALGIRDHQVMSASLNPYEVIVKLIWRSLKLFVFAILGMPGLILFAPVLVATKVVSRKKAAQALKASTVKINARDVIATWKVLVALGLTPLLYNTYAGVATYMLYRRGYIEWYAWQLSRTFVVILSALAVMSYGTLYIGERGMDIFKSLRPLALAINPSQKNSLENLKHTREELTTEITDVVNTLGPELYPEIDKERVFYGRNDRDETQDEEDEERRRHHFRKASNTSTTSTSSDHDISRVNSESDLANIPVFSSMPDSSASPSISRAHSRTPSGPNENIPVQSRSSNLTQKSSTGQQVFQSEVTQRIRAAMAQRQQERASDKNPENE